MINVNMYEVNETYNMIEHEKLDVRTITLGISLLDCVDSNLEALNEKIYKKITTLAKDLVSTGQDIEADFGIPIVNKRISVTPIALVGGSACKRPEDFVTIAKTLDLAAKEVGVNFIGGYSALVSKGMTRADKNLILSIPQALSQTERVCSSVNVGSTKTGIDMDAVELMGRIVTETAEATRDHDSLGCAKLVVFCNAPDDNPFMAGAFHGVTESEAIINVGVSGPGVVKVALAKVRDANFEVLCETIKKTAFKITRVGQLVAQEASRRLGFTATRTMRAAQTLYEGVDIAGQGTMGLITYMRTDSLRIADEAQAAAKEFITETYGPEYVCPQKRTYKSKSATAAQDAHEAVRPTNPALTPAEVEKSVSGDPAKLYRLIWSRFIASQMSDCQQDTVSADITAAGYLFRASGYVVTFDGFTTLYEEATDEKEKKETALPPLEEGMVLKLRELKPEQKFTQPPARYTEATLIKALEENGIGRPSTYAPIITTIIDRDYVERDQKKLAPTTLGRVINELMLEQFPNIVDVKFSAHMEEELDTIENGKTDWHEVIDDFYTDFDKTLKEAEVKMEGKRIKVPDEETDEVCELCGRKMVIKSGRYGKFLACPGFPECKNTKRLVKDTGGLCPKCGSRMLVRHSKKGRVYYGCEKNPTCDFMTWNEPTTEKCPECGSTLFKKGGKNGILLCEKEGCGYSRALGAEKKE